MLHVGSMDSIWKVGDNTLIALEDCSVWYSEIAVAGGEPIVRLSKANPLLLSAYKCSDMEQRGQLSPLKYLCFPQTTWMLRISFDAL